MDTDDLSIRTYNAVIIAAEKFHHDLTLQFGLLAADCKNEKEYLKHALLLIEKCRSNPGMSMDEIFYDNFPRVSEFLSNLSEIKKSIKAIQKMPIEKRTIKKW